jgi:CheY-like chemotaxis protein
VRRIADLREVRTKTYATGAQMVDLGNAGAPPAIDRGRALVLVSEEYLARVVSLLLKHAGFEVVRAEDAAHLERLTASGRPRLVVAQGGTDAAGTRRSGGFVPPAERDYRVVALVSGNGRGALAAAADRVLELPFDPGSFTADILLLTERS